MTYCSPITILYYSVRPSRFHLRPLGWKILVKCHLYIETHRDKSLGMLDAQEACNVCALKRFNMNNCSHGDAPVVKKWQVF